MLKFTKNDWKEEVESIGAKETMNNFLLIILSIFFSGNDQSFNVYFDCKEIRKDIGDKIMLDGVIHKIECSPKQGIKIQKED